MYVFFEKGQTNTYKDLIANTTSFDALDLPASQMSLIYSGNKEAPEEILGGLSTGNGCKGAPFSVMVALILQLR